MTHPDKYSMLAYTQGDNGIALVQQYYRNGDVAGLDEPISGKTVFETNDEIAILFYYNEESPEQSVLLKHGTAKEVYDFTRKAGRADEVVISGHFQVDDLNKIINVSGYIGQFYSEMKKNAEPKRRHKFQASELSL